MKKTTGFAMKVLAVVLAAALVLGTSGVRAYAATNSPDYGDDLMDMVFSVKRPTIISNDKTLNGNDFDGKPVADYYQIHEDLEKTGDDASRYSVAVSGPAVSAAIDKVLNEYTGGTSYIGIHNINETDDLKVNGGDQSGLAEKVLRAVLGDQLYDSVNVLADNYIRTQLGIAAEANAAVTIDWYVVKHQKDGRVGGRYHVDGNATVTVKEYDEWTVVYNFEQKNSDPERIALEATISVEKNTTPSFNREEIKAPSDVDSKFEDDHYILRADEYELAVVELDPDTKTINIYYDLVRDEWIVAYTFEMKDADPARFELEDKLVVFMGGTPDFGEEDILAPSAVNEELSDDAYVLFVNEDGAKFVLTDDKTIEIRYDLVKEDPTNEDPTNEDPTNEDPTNEDPTNDDPKEDPKQDDTPDIPSNIIPPVNNADPEPTEEPKEEEEEIPVDEVPGTPEGTPEEEEEEEIPVDEVPGTPEGAPEEEEEEEIPIDEVPGTPEGAPEEEEEEIPVDMPETPEGGVLPQTGVASAVTFFGFGAAFIGLGAFAVIKATRKEEI